jgi:serine/threonine protein kinase
LFAFYFFSVRIQAVGEGSYGTVFKAIWRKQVVAVKVRNYDKIDNLIKFADKIWLITVYQGLRKECL